MVRRKRRYTTRPRTTYRTRTYKRRRRVVRTPRLDLGPRPVFTLAVWFGLAVGISFLAYAIFGTSVWSDATLDVVPIKLALMLALALLGVSGCIFAGMQFGWFETGPDTPTRRTRRRRSTRKK